MVNRKVTMLQAFSSLHLIYIQEYLLVGNLSYVPMTIVAYNKNGKVIFRKIDAVIINWSEGTTKELNLTVYESNHEFNEIKVLLDEKCL